MVLSAGFVVRAARAEDTAERALPGTVRGRHEMLSSVYRQHRLVERSYHSIGRCHVHLR